MASIVVTPSSVAIAGTITIVYSGGTKIKFLSPCANKTINRTSNSGTFTTTLPCASLWTVQLRRNNNIVDTTSVTVSDAPPPPPPPVTGGYGVAYVPAIATYLQGNPTTPGTAGNHEIKASAVTYDGYSDIPWKMQGSNWADTTVQKVIKNCIFKNADLPALMGNSCVARNVLIYGCTFLNIRTNVPGIGVHAINASGTTDKIKVVGCTFREIGADGIQWGGGSTSASGEWLVEYNDFTGPGNRPVNEYWGENAWDVKGVDGPITIRNNIIEGFRPCVSPKKGGQQDCSGSPGVGAVIHKGALSGIAKLVTISGNLWRDNKPFGLTITEQSDGIVLGPGNVFESGQDLHVLVDDTVVNSTHSLSDDYDSTAGTEFGAMTAAS